MDATVVRLLIAAGICSGLVGALRLLTAVVLRRSTAAARHLAQFTPGTPGVVFFTTPDCMTCRTAQRPALDALSRRLGRAIQVIELDALDNSTLAREWSVLSVPTTFILDRDGHPRQVNHGFTSTDKLASQLAALR